MKNRKKRKYMLLYCVVCQVFMVAWSSVCDVLKTGKTKSSRSHFSHSNCSIRELCGRNRKIYLRIRDVFYSRGNLNISTLPFPAIYLYLLPRRVRLWERTRYSVAQNEHGVNDLGRLESSAFSYDLLRHHRHRYRYPVASIARKMRRDIIKPTTSH